jgi:hypothetical protein
VGCVLFMFSDRTMIIIFLTGTNHDNAQYFAEIAAAWEDVSDVLVYFWTNHARTALIAQ